MFLAEKQHRTQTVPKPYPNEFFLNHPFDEGLHPVCRLPSHRLCYMSVSVKGERSGVVPHVFLQRFYVISCPDAVDCEGVPQIVYTVMLKACC